MDDLILFLNAWASHPLCVGAIAPSGQALANAISAEIIPVNAPVIEIGAGTGVFTKAIIARGINQDKLVLIDNSADFTRLLRVRFPDARVLWMDAARLRGIELFGDELAGVVVSGLPLISMTPKKVIAVLNGAFRHLRTDGTFYQFTYGPRCPVPRPILDRLGLKATRICSVIANLPPASVYRIRRRPPMRNSVMHRAHLFEI